MKRTRPTVAPDPSRTLAERLARGEVTRQQVIAVASALANLHARARQVEVVGVPALAVERRLTENFHQLLSIIEQRAEIERVLALERFAHAFVVAHARMFHARARGGHVREGHGDRRAERVLLDDRRAWMVEGGESEHGVNGLDVADDLAVLVVDLVAHGGGHVAEALVRAYRDAGGEPGEDALVSFYAAYRALVRAKVALLRAAQHPPASAAHGRESATARDLLAVAERFAWRARLPLALVVCGVPASGKSNVARALAEASDLAHLRSDATPTYAALGRRTSKEVAARGGAVVDATFCRRADRDAFAAGFAAAAPLLFVECRAPLAALARPTAGQDQECISSWEPLDEVAADAHLTLRTDRPIESVMGDILGLLDERVTCGARPPRGSPPRRQRPSPRGRTARVAAPPQGEGAVDPDDDGSGGA
jgi:uncharacterized protein